MLHLRVVLFKDTVLYTVYLDCTVLYRNDPALREPAERGGSGLLADFAQKCVVSQRPAILLLRPFGHFAESGSLNVMFS